MLWGTSAVRSATSYPTSGAGSIPWNARSGPIEPRYDSPPYRESLLAGNLSRRHSGPQSGHAKQGACNATPAAAGPLTLANSAPSEIMMGYARCMPRGNPPAAGARHVGCHYWLVQQCQYGWASQPCHPNKMKLHRCGETQCRRMAKENWPWASTSDRSR